MELQIHEHCGAPTLRACKIALREINVSQTKGTDSLASNVTKTKDCMGTKSK